jgi:hypothetical protein
MGTDSSPMDDALNLQINRRLLMTFYLGNLCAVILLPLIPLFLIWLVTSCVIYCLLIGYPDPHLKRSLQWAGYRFYGSIGLCCIVAPFFHQFADLWFWYALWGFAVVVVVPLTIMDIFQTFRSSILR